MLDQVLCVLYMPAPLTPSLPCLPFSPTTRTLEPQGLKAASQRVRSHEKARPGEHWGLHRATEGLLTSSRNCPEPLPKRSLDPIIHPPCLDIQCPVQGRGRGSQEGGRTSQVPRGAWEGIFCWLEAREPGTRRLEDGMVMLSKGRKSCVGEWKPEAESCCHPAGTVCSQDREASRGYQEHTAGRQNQLPAGWLRPQPPSTPYASPREEARHTAAGTVCKGADPCDHTLTFSSVRPFSTESATFCRMRCRNAWRREAGRCECPHRDFPGMARKKGHKFKCQLGPRRYHSPGTRAGDLKNKK